MIFLVNVGPLYLESSGLRYWGADNFFSGGSTYSVSSIPISNTVDDFIFSSERVGTFSYQIPVPVGTYEVTIHLAELYVQNSAADFFVKIIKYSQSFLLAERIRCPVNVNSTSTLKELSSQMSIS
jgi:Malectin domain